MIFQTSNAKLMGKLWPMKNPSYKRQHFIAGVDALGRTDEERCLQNALNQVDLVE